MELFVQQVLGAVSLNQQADELHFYFHSFSGWVARQRKKWTAEKIVPAALYHKKKRESTRNQHTQLFKTREGYLVSDNMLPWVVFGCHVICNYSTNVTEISSFLTKAGFKPLSGQLIADILSWSTYPTRRSLSDESRDFSTRVFSLLESLDASQFPYCKSAYIQNTWRELYKHHLGSHVLNPLSQQPGVVFFGLIRLEKHVYSVVFIDAMTEATEFSHVFCTSRDVDNDAQFSRLSREVGIALTAFFSKHGHPRYMILVNPLSDWLYHVISLTLTTFFTPLTTTFISCLPKSDFTRVLQKPEPVLSSIAFVLEHRDISEIPPFRYLKSDDSSWKVTFASNIHWAQKQLFHDHPKSQTSDFGPNKLLVGTIEGLTVMETDNTTYRMLKVKPPRRLKCDPCPLDIQEVLAESDDVLELLKKGDRFSLSPGHVNTNLLIDHVSQQALLYLYELSQSTGPSQTALLQSQEKYTQLNEDDLFWVSHGVEILPDKSFGPALPFEGDKSEFLNTTGRQLHLREQKQVRVKEVKKEVKKEKVKKGHVTLENVTEKSPRNAAKVAAQRVTKAYKENPPVDDHVSEADHVTQDHVTKVKKAVTPEKRSRKETLVIERKKRRVAGGIGSKRHVTRSETSHVTEEEGHVSENEDHVSENEDQVVDGKKDQDVDVTEKEDNSSHVTEKEDKRSHVIEANTGHVTENEVQMSNLSEEEDQVVASEDHEDDVTEKEDEPSHMTQKEDKSSHVTNIDHVTEEETSHVTEKEDQGVSEKKDHEDGVHEEDKPSHVAETTTSHVTEEEKPSHVTNTNHVTEENLPNLWEDYEPEHITDDEEDDLVLFSDPEYETREDDEYSRARDMEKVSEKVKTEEDHVTTETSVVTGYETIPETPEPVEVVVSAETIPDSQPFPRHYSELFTDPAEVSTEQVREAALFLTKRRKRVSESVELVRSKFGGDSEDESQSSDSDVEHNFKEVAVLPCVVTSSPVDQQVAIVSSVVSSPVEQQVAVVSSVETPALKIPEIKMEPIEELNQLVPVVNSDFSHLPDFPLSYPVPRMVLEDAEANPGATYQVVSSYEGTQYPDATVLYSSESEWEDDPDYADVDFGEEYRERVERRGEVREVFDLRLDDWEVGEGWYEGMIY